MDPNATLASIDYALSRLALDEYAGQECDDACEDLWRWLSRGGFDPDWKKYRIATGHYLSRVQQHESGVRRFNVVNIGAFRSCACE